VAVPSPVISVAIMAHPRRASWVPQLEEQIGGNVQVVWDERNDRWDTGRRSLLAYHEDATHHVVIQDDALVCRDLLAGLRQIAAQAGNRPVGLYTGNLRPSHHLVAANLAAARHSGTPWWEGEGPWWGVGIMLPTVDIPKVVAWGDSKPQIANYDMRISRWYLSQNRPCWYTVPSLVEHRHGDGNPSLVPGRTATNRCARWFIGEDRSALDIDWSVRPDGRMGPRPPAASHAPAGAELWNGESMNIYRHVVTGNEVKTIPGSAAERRLLDRPQHWQQVNPPDPEPASAAPELVGVDEAVEAAATGAGWYRTPDGGKVRGRDAAVEAWTP
jgi:hypothetical protein